MPVQHVRRTAAIASAALAAIASTAVPAQADTEKVRDGRDSSIAADIRSVRVVHDETLRVRINAVDLKRSRRHVQGANIYVDTRRSRPGPERMIEMGLWKDADHVVTKARRWHRTGAEPIVNPASPSTIGRIGQPSNSAQTASAESTADCGSPC